MYEEGFMQLFSHAYHPPQILLPVRRWRDDFRCGPDFPLEDGSPTECNPDSPNFCCSNSGWCDNTPQHCSCDNCINYRQHSAGDIQPGELK